MTNGMGFRFVSAYALSAIYLMHLIIGSSLDPNLLSSLLISRGFEWTKPLPQGSNDRLHLLKGFPYGLPS